MTEPVLQVDPEIFAAYFDREPFHVRHALASHRSSSCRGSSSWRARRPSRSSSTTAPTCRSAYGALLDRCLDEVARQVGSLVPKMLRREGFIFLSWPGATTPFHLDPEHNFLLQVRGGKTVSMWDQDDRFVLPECELETFYSAFVHRNLPWRDVFQTTAWTAGLSPGQGDAARAVGAARRHQARRVCGAGAGAPAPRRWTGAPGTGRLNDAGAAAGHEVHDEQDQADHERDMNESAGDVKGGHSEKPGNQDDGTDDREHMLPPLGFDK